MASVVGALGTMGTILTVGGAAIGGLARGVDSTLATYNQIKMFRELMKRREDEENLKEDEKNNRVRVKIVDPRFAQFLYSKCSERMKKGFVRSTIFHTKKSSGGTFIPNFIEQRSKKLIENIEEVIINPKVLMEKGGIQSYKLESLEFAVDVQYFSFLSRWLNTNLKEYNRKSEGKVRLMEFSRRTNEWEIKKLLSRRTKKSLILPVETKNRIFNHIIPDFKKSKKVYEELGKKYKTGLLFYGPPGNGKSSLAMTIASEMGWDICNVNLLQLGTEEVFKSAMVDKLPKKCIVLIEDMDTFFDEARSRKMNMSDLSMSTLFNVIDGACSPDDCIFIFTTNFIDKLDQALIRRGRVDNQIQLQNPTIEMVSQLYERIFKCEPSPETVFELNKFLPDQFPMALYESVFVSFRLQGVDNPTTENIITELGPLGGEREKELFLNVREKQREGSDNDNDVVIQPRDFTLERLRLKEFERVRYAIFKEKLIGMPCFRTVLRRYKIKEISCRHVHIRNDEDCRRYLISEEEVLVTFVYRQEEVEGEEGEEEEVT